MKLEGQWKRLWCDGWSDTTSCPLLNKVKIYAIYRDWVGRWLAMGCVYYRSVLHCEWSKLKAFYCNVLLLDIKLFAWKIVVKHRSLEHEREKKRIRSISISLSLCVTFDLAIRYQIFHKINSDSAVNRSQNRLKVHRWVMTIKKRKIK